MLHHNMDWSRFREIIKPELWSYPPPWFDRLYASLNGENGGGPATPAADDVFTEGKRHPNLLRMAGAMRQAGLDGDAIYAALADTNARRCVPPKTDEEVRKLAYDVAQRYEADEWADVTVKLTRPAPGTNGHASKTGPPPTPVEIVRILASQLRRLPAADKWTWEGLIPAEQATIFSALPKVGKTTLLAHLMRTMGPGGGLCGQAVRAGRVLCVTEESETIWAERRDRLGLQDHCEFVLRPFRTKPTMPQWVDFIKRLTDSIAGKPADVVIIDTLAKLWPVCNENDASEVTAALMPLLEIAYGLRVTLLLVHHLRKSGGEEATATRGSGGITAAVDSILEFRRYRPSDRKDRRRVLNCDARFDDRLDEAVVELSPDGLSYTAHGDRGDVTCRDLSRTALEVLPDVPPGLTFEQVKEFWPGDEGVRSENLRAALKSLAEQGKAVVIGTGRKGDPLSYYRPQEAP